MGNIHLSADRQARPTSHVLSEVEGSMQKAWRSMYVARLYERVCHRKGHAVAVGAVARYLSEATFWV